MSARQGRRDGVVFFESQQVVVPAQRRWTTIVIAVLVLASIVAVGLWRLLLSQ